MFDSLLPESKDHLPLTWWKTYPIYLAAVIALVAAASIIFTAIVGYESAPWLIFTYHTAFGEWRLWTMFTYVFFNPPSIWVVLGCFLLWNFGEAIERHLGRRSFVRLLAILWVTPPALVTLMGLMGFQGPWTLGMLFSCPLAAGVTILEFSVFNAFAALYPKAKISLIIVTLDAWVMAAIFSGVYALQLIAHRQWSSLIVLLGSIAVAWACIRFEKGELKLPSLPKPHFKNTPSLSSRSSASPGANPKPARSAKPKGPSVDDILDKISHQGMQSLTPEERRILDQASEEMKKRAR